MWRVARIKAGPHTRWMHEQSQNGFNARSLELRDAKVNGMVRYGIYSQCKEIQVFQIQYFIFSV